MSDTAAPQPHDIRPVAIEEEMRRSYLDYAMSVIVARALPDVRDGLKPVHRRILFAMNQEGYTADRSFRKAARVVGDVMGKYHPHGDAAIYDAMVRMAQDFSMRLALIDGQGNFGSMDGDPPAAMRYTEVRLAPAAHTLLEDIDRDTVDFQANYDASAEEPTVLPAQFPNLLANGAGGIAVGMATNIPPHNLGEVIDASCAYVDNPDISIEELMELVPGPDFPTGGTILGRSVIRAAYQTGRGSLAVRGRAYVEEVRKGREAIVITEIPYQVNKARMIERIAELVRERRIEGVADLRDESDREGLRVVVELKREAVADVVLNQLYHYTPLQTTFGVNMLALDGGRPVLMNLKDIIAAFVAFRENVITRRTKFELAKARERAHVLVGLAVAVANLDAAVRLIRESRDPAAARARLLGRSWPARDVAPLVELIDEPGRKVERGAYRLSEAQARAILDLRLQKLTGLEREKLHDELRSLGDKIAEYLSLLRSRKRLLALLKEELVKVRDRFADDRRTALEEGEFEQDIEDLIQREDMVVTVSHGGYIKRVPLSTYRSQRRGGKGRAGMSTREEDFVSQVYVVNTHTPMLFFSTIGKVYKLKVYRLPLGTPQARGKALVNLLPLAEGETISTVMPFPDDEDTWDDLQLMFATARGTVRRNRLSDFAKVPSNGKIAMKLAAKDRLVGVRACAHDQNVLLATRAGKCVRFSVEDVRVFSGRTSIGVRGIKVSARDEVISLSMLKHAKADVGQRDEYLQAVNAKRRLATADYTDKPEERERDERLAKRLEEPQFIEMAMYEEFILTVSASGYGKRTSAYDYRISRRGGKGIENISLVHEGDAVVASFPVADTDQIMLVTDGGQLIRCPVHDIRIARRATQGVTLFNVAEDERVVSVAWLAEGGPVEEGPEVEEEGAHA